MLTGKPEMNSRKFLLLCKLSLVMALGYLVIRNAFLPEVEAVFPASAHGNQNSQVVEETITPKVPFEDYSSIVERNIFSHPQSSSKKQDMQHNRVYSIERAEKELGLVLLGTIAGSPAVSRAIIKEVNNNTIRPYKIKDSVGDCSVECIEKDKVVLLRGDQRIVLTIGGETSDQQGTYTLPQRSLNKPQKVHSLAKLTPAKQGPADNIETILKKAVIKPYRYEGKNEGLRITGLEGIEKLKNSFIRNGDVIREINGHKLTDKQKAYQIIKKARSQKTLTLELERDGNPKHFSFEMR